MNLIKPDELFPPAKEYAEDFLHDFNTSKRRKLAYGNNIYTKSLIENYEIDGIVDDFSSKPSTLPVYRTSDINGEDMVVVCSGGNILTAFNNAKASTARTIDYFHFRHYSPFKLAPIHFNEGFREGYEKNFSKFQNVYDLLNDEESKIIFQQLVSFRYSENIEYLEGFRDKQDSQYFEDFLELNEEGETFWDVGAFDGQNTQQFISRCPNYRSVNMFEPEPANFKKIHEEFDGLPRTNIHNFGFAEKNNFSTISSSGSTSRLSSDVLAREREGGQLGERIELRTVDSLIGILDPPSFLKMDIEGSEENALIGASRTINEYAPKMALSVYHKIDDFWKIPFQVLRYQPKYQLRFRHYTESIYETVAFFTD